MLRVFLAAWAITIFQSGVSDEISSPPTWVSFTADVRGVGPGGPFEGRFYRGADGSTRKETGPPGRPIDSIVIRNNLRGEQYVCRNGCVTRAVELLSAPPRMRRTPRLIKLESPIEGFEAYLSQSGTTSTVVPALNFFAIEMKSSALTERYSNIRIGSQPPALFERPEPPPRRPNKQTSGRNVSAAHLR